MSFEIEPIQGQPGLFRYQERDLGEITPPPFGAPCCGQALPDRQGMPPLSMRLGSIEDQLYAAAEWSKASLQVTPETPLSPIFQRNLRGFGQADEAPAEESAPLPQGPYTARIIAARAIYEATKNALQSVFAAHGGPLDTASYQELAAEVSRLRAAPLLRLVASDVANLLKAGLAVAGNCLGLATLINNGPNAQTYSVRAGALLSASEGVLLAINRVLDAGRRFDEATDVASRAVGALKRAAGLGAIPAAAFVAGGAVIVIGGGLLYLLLSQIASAVSVYAQASAACAADERAGVPCTGEAWTSYADREATRQQTTGVVPDTGSFFREAGRGVGSAFRGAAWIAAIGVVGYLVWTTLPAAKAARERLAEKAAG